VNLIYWGKYTAHDNNRDGMVLSQRLTQNVIKAFLQWKPVVMHDLHESVRSCTPAPDRTYNE